MLSKSPREIYEVKALQNIFFRGKKTLSVAFVPLSLTITSLYCMVEFKITHERDRLSYARVILRVQAICNISFKIYSSEGLNEKSHNDDQKFKQSTNIAEKL